MTFRQYKSKEANKMALRNSTTAIPIAVEGQPKDVNSLLARIAELEKNQKRVVPISFKVSDKGGVSVYGLGRFPVTLYKEQWVRLLAEVDKLKEFIQANDSKLTTK